MRLQGNKTASAFTKFRLLMWKNFLQQWRHRWQTLVELLLPVGTMAIVLVLRMEIEPVNHDVIRYPPIPAQSFNYSIPILQAMKLTDLSIAYSPRSPELEDIVRTAAVNLFASNMNDIILLVLKQIQENPDVPPIEIPPDLHLNSTLALEIAKLLINVQGYDSSSALLGVYSDEENTRRVIAAVEFDDSLLGATALPNDVKYALRFPEKPRLHSFLGRGGSTWHTDELFPFFQVPGPRLSSSEEGGNNPGYVIEMFIALQNSISMELVSRLTDTDLSNFTTNIQRFPHPSYVEDFAVEALSYIFSLFVMISFSYTAVNIVRAVTLEKENQLKEIMKIMGLPTWLHWTAWFCKQFVYMFIMAVLIVLLLKVHWFSNAEGFNDYAVFTNTPWSVLLFFILLYFTCMILFCFMLSTFFNKASTAALFTGVIWFLTYLPSFVLSMDSEVSPFVQGLSCLLINSAMSYGFQLLISQESLDGMTWGNFFTTHSLDSNRLLFGHVVVLLVVNCILYMLIALYFEQVLPGPWGTPRPWYFPFQKTFWCPGSAVKDADLVVDNNTTNIVKEEDPIGHKMSVRISNLTKVYGNNVAVNNVNLNIYNDQITVLLGHNGAGKSTTISMITGNTSISRGSVWLAGYDISTQLNLARAQIGLCPQHNVLFNELTVREHLEFFAKLKGFSGQQLQDEINTLIEKMEMQEKRDYMAEGLSGGQKRRLCVGIALSGGAQVILLDEPTSGMDPTSRRALWNLLEREKKGRAMILTTHFMDEADYLGDRIAIMSSGTLQCVGSPFFLKNYYGLSYSLIVVKSPGFQLNLCTEIIDKYIPGTQPKDDDATEVIYKLPITFRPIFEDLLNELQRNVEHIRFKNYGLVATTLEDVFLSVGSDVELNPDSDQTSENFDDFVEQNPFDFSSTEQLNSGDGKLTGIRLIAIHILATWLKLLLVWSRSWGLLLLQILVPILQINISLGISNFINGSQSNIIRRLLSLTKGYLSTETLVTFDGSSPYSLGGYARAGFHLLYRVAGVESMELNDLNGRTIDDYYLERTDNPRDMSALRNRLLIGATLNDNSATAWFSNFGYHDVATSLATLHSALLKGLNSVANITVYNHPLEVNYRDDSNQQQTLAMMSLQVATSIGNSLAIVSAVFIMFYIKERVLRAKLLQRAAGVQPAVMWGAAAVFDWTWFLILSLTIIISCAAFQVVGLSTAQELGRMYLCLMVYGAAMLPLHYLFSLVFNGPAVGFVLMFFVNILFGLMGAQVVETLSIPGLKNGETVANVMDNILQFFPLYSLVTSIRKLNNIGLTKHTCMQSCDYLLTTFPNVQECTMQTLCDNLLSSCCIRENSFFDWEEPGILRYLTCMLVSSVVLWSVFMLLEYNIIQKLILKIRKNRVEPERDRSTIDPDVAMEEEHARRASPMHSVLLARRLTKRYGKNLAVDQLSFSVGEGECFGLLGVNGAGKTTTFKMLMGDESITSGDAYVCGYSVKSHRTKVYEYIGYCPQFDAVFGELTGRETLMLFSMYRGIRLSNTRPRTAALAATLGFTKHLDKRADQYSGGNRRKLSTAVALLGGGRLVYVDEPTTGVDPAAKRQVWGAIRSARRANMSFVLTSHSMEECEALCSRLTVMVRGRFQCIGSPQYLKNKFSQGYTLTIKVKNSDSFHPGPRGIDVIKAYVRTNFNNPKLMEEYQGLITYNLPDRSVSWARMFGIMERAKRDLPVEDYSILQTSLEQIFLQFTKYAQDDEAQRTNA